MSYLRLEKAVMTNLEESLRREFSLTAIRVSIMVCSLFPYQSSMTRIMFFCRLSTVR